MVLYFYSYSHQTLNYKTVLLQLIEKTFNLSTNIHLLTVKGKVSGITTTFKQRCKPVHFSGYSNAFRTLLPPIHAGVRAPFSAVCYKKVQLQKALVSRKDFVADKIMKKSATIICILLPILLKVIFCCIQTAD